MTKPPSVNRMALFDTTTGKWIVSVSVWTLWNTAALPSLGLPNGCRIPCAEAARLNRPGIRKERRNERLYHANILSPYLGSGVYVSVFVAVVSAFPVAKCTTVLLLTLNVDSFYNMLLLAECIVAFRVILVRPLRDFLQVACVWAIDRQHLNPSAHNNWQPFEQIPGSIVSLFVHGTEVLMPHLQSCGFSSNAPD